jgi:murein DD-endopeptidase MepM/ murein hydrolase activator NlpD
MRRVDRIRVERRRRLALVFGLAFSLGALTSAVLIWRADHPADALISAAGTSAAEAPLDGSARQPTSGGAAPTTAVVSVAPAPTMGSRDSDSTRLLKTKRLNMPLDGVSRDRLRDTFDESRAAGLRRHEAIDIMAPKGTPVRAVEDARVAKLFKSVAGGLTIYLEDPTGTFTYYYAHLDRYAPGLKEDQHVRRGELIGFVGSTGNASDDAPHLHFAIFQMGPERRWWQGEPINPFPVLR